MSKFAFYKFFTFIVFSHDLLNEPPHLHIVKSKSNRIYSAKIWIESLEFSATADFTKTELALIKRLVEKSRDIFFEMWNSAKRGEPVKILELTL